MIETTIPEINVTELIARVRAKAAELHQVEKRKICPDAQAQPELPSLGAIAPPPPVALPRPARITKEQISAPIERARSGSGAPRWVPKFLRSFFRKQGAVNRGLLESSRLLAKSNGELVQRVEQLSACIRVQQSWLEELHHHIGAERQWRAEVSRALTSKTVALEQLRTELESTQRIHRAETDRTASEIAAVRVGFQALRADGERAGAHLNNLQAETNRNSAHAERTAAHLNNLVARFEDMSNGFQALRADGERTGAHLNNLQAETNRNSEIADSLLPRFEDIFSGFEALRSDGVRTGAHLQNLQTQADRQSVDHTQLQQAITRLEERVTDDGSFLKGELSHYRTVIEHLVRSRNSSGKSNAAPSPRAKSEPIADTGALDSFYLTFENRFRGPRAEIKERHRVYLPLIDAAEAGKVDLPILDLGCGRGEWLELLRESHLSARGVDLNAVMIAQCTERKLDVVQSDAVEYLRSLPKDSQGAVTGFHIIEHLPLETLIQLIAETHRVLAPGGVVIFESPNCKNLVVGACNFNIDPTHRNPVYPETAEFMLSISGFVQIEIKYLSPAEGSPFDQKQPTSSYLNDRFFGPQDFAVIGFKPTKR